MDDLPPSWRGRAEQELNESNQAATNIEILRTKLIEDPNLTPRTDTPFLLTFLRAKKHNVEKTFKMIKNFYEVRRKYRSYYELCLPFEKGIYEQNGHMFYPHRDPSGSPIFIYKPGNYDADTITPELAFQSIIVSLQVLIEDPTVQVAGIHFIVDLDNITLQHQAKLVNFTSISVAANMLQESFPLRVRSIFVVKEPWFFSALFALIKPFLNKKLRKKVFIYGNNWNLLHKHLGPDLLPETYGGTLPPQSQDYMINMIQTYEDKIREWWHYGYHCKKK